MFLAHKLTINRKNITFRLTTVFLVILTIGCSKNANENVQASSISKRILTLGNGRESVTLDPHLAASWADLRVIEGLFEGLVTLDPLSGKSVPGVAESWSSSHDDINYLFKLRDDAKWSNGTKVLAEDFVQFAERMRIHIWGLTSLFIFYTL